MILTLAVAVVFIIIGSVMLIINVFGKKNDELSFSSVYSFSNDLILGSRNDTSGIYNLEGKIIEKLPIEKFNSVVLSDYGYYFIVNDDNSFDLKRNGKVVASEKNYNGEFKLYNDKSDKNSFYINVSNSFSSYELDKSGLNENIIAVTGINESDILTTLVYNKKTGEILSKNKHLEDFIINNTVSDKYYVIVNDNQTYGLFDKKSYNIIFDNYESIGDDFYNGELISNNTKYVTVSKNSKYGVLDYNGKEIIPFDYDEIRFNSNNQKYFSAIKNRKFGLLDFDNNEKLPFLYDSILVLDKYIITQKDNMITILDENLKQVESSKTCVLDEEVDISFDTSNIIYNGDSDFGVVFSYCDDFGSRYLLSIYNKDKIIEDKKIGLVENNSVINANIKFFELDKKKITFYDKDIKKIKDVVFKEEINIDNNSNNNVFILSDDWFIIKESFSSNISNNEEVYQVSFDGNFRYLLQSDIDNNKYINLNDGYKYLKVKDDKSLILYKNNKQVFKTKGEAIQKINDNLFFIFDGSKYLLKKISN